MILALSLGVQPVINRIDAVLKKIKRFFMIQLFYKTVSKVTKVINLHEINRATPGKLCASSG
jgi:hypothetical protein